MEDTTERVSEPHINADTRGRIKAVSVRWLRRPERFWVRWVDHGVGFTGYRIGPFYVGVERD